MMAACLAAVPGTVNWGIYSKRTIAGTNTWSNHASGRALDVGCSRKALGDALVLKIVPHVIELGICEVIWYNQRWSAKGDGLPYKVSTSSPTLAHRDHVHISLTRFAACREDTPAVRAALLAVMNS